MVSRNSWDSSYARIDTVNFLNPGGHAWDTTWKILGLVFAGEIRQGKRWNLRWFGGLVLQVEELMPESDGISDQNCPWRSPPEVQHTKSPLKIVVKTILCNFQGACVVKLWGFVWSKDLLRDWMWHWYFANLCCMKCHARKSVFAPKTLIMQDGFWYFEICMSSTKNTPRNWPGNGYCNQSFKIWIFQPSRGCIISVSWDHAFSVPPVRFSYSS